MMAKVRKGLMVQATAVSVDKPLVETVYVYGYNEVQREGGYRRPRALLAVFRVGKYYVFYVPAKVKRLERALRSLGFRYSRDLVATVLGQRLVHVSSDDDYPVRLRISADFMRGLARLFGLSDSEIGAEIEGVMKTLRTKGIVRDTESTISKVIMLFNIVSTIDRLLWDAVSNRYGEYDYFKYATTDTKVATHWPNLPFIRKDGEVVSFKAGYVYPKGFYKIVPEETYREELARVMNIIRKYDGVLEE